MPGEMSDGSALQNKGQKLSHKAKKYLKHAPKKNDKLFGDLLDQNINQTLTQTDEEDHFIGGDPESYMTDGYSSTTNKPHVTKRRKGHSTLNSFYTAESTSDERALIPDNIYLTLPEIKERKRN